MPATYRFILKPEEVAEVEISIAQCYRGVTLLEIAPRCADQVPHLQHRLVKRNSFNTMMNEATDVVSILKEQVTLFGNMLICFVAGRSLLYLYGKDEARDSRLSLAQRLEKDRGNWSVKKGTKSIY